MPAESPEATLMGFTATELVGLRRFLDERSLTLSRLYSRVRILEQSIGLEFQSGR